jgi:flotillin
MLLVAAMLAGALALALPLPAPHKIAAAVLVAWLLGMLGLLSQLMVVARPAQALVMSGRARHGADGTRRGFRTMVAGRALRIPLMEQVTSFELGVFRVPLTVRGALDRSGRSIEVELVAHARVDPSPAALERAIERLLAAGPAERARLVERAVDRAARGVVGSLELAELEAERAKLAEVVRSEALAELSAVGLELASLHVLRIESEDA